MRHAIYTRNEDGTVEFKGNQDWMGMSQQQVAEVYYRGDETPRQEVMAGWPHRAVVWFGDLGFGAQ